MKIQNFLIALLFVLSPMATIGAGAQNPVWGEGGPASGAGIGSESCTDDETGVSLLEPLLNDGCRSGLVAGDLPDECVDPAPDNADPVWSQTCAIFVGVLGWTLSEDDRDEDGRADTAYFETDNPVAGMGIWDPTKSQWADEWLDACYLDGTIWGLSPDDCDSYTFNEGETLRVYVQLDYIDNSDGRQPVIEQEGDLVHIHVLNAMVYLPDGSFGASGQTTTITLDPARNAYRASGLLAIDIDPIDPVTSTEMEDDNSIEEARDGDGNYVNNVATWIYIELPALPILPDPFGFPDDTGLDFSKIHVKWPGNRGEPIDLVGLYAKKYANIDDDPDTDLDELQCPGQPTNPTNPRAHCGNWDGDGLGNYPEDPNPRTPDVFMTLAFADSLVTNGHWEAPHAGGFTYDCSGPDVDMRLWVKYNDGNWQYRPGFGNDLLSTPNPTSGQTGCVEDGIINPYTETNSGTDLRKVSYKLTTSTSAGVGFESNVISYTLLGNTLPGGELILECHDVDSRDGDPCEGDGHIDNRVGYTFKFAIDGTGLDEEVGFDGEPQHLVTGRFACENINGADIDRDSANGRQCASVSRDDDGNIVYRVPDDGRYFAGANVVVDLTIRDNGMAQTVHRYEFTIPKARPVLTDPSVTETLTGGTSASVHLYDGGQHRHGAMDVNVHWRHQGEDEFQAVSLACSTDCAARDSVGNNPANSVPLTHQGMTFSGSFSPDAGTTVEYYFSALNPHGFTDETEVATYEVGTSLIPSPDDLKVPNPIDYVYGDCNFLGDFLILIGLGEGEFCASEATDQHLPIVDVMDFRDVDGDPSNDDESNGQIDAVEMYVGYWQERDGRMNIHLMVPSGTVKPATDEAARVSLGDETAGPNADDDITKHVVIESQGVFICVYDTAENQGLIGRGGSEEAACSSTTSDDLNVVGAELAALNEALTGDAQPLFVVQDENGDGVPESITINVIDLTSCEPVGDPVEGEVDVVCELMTLEIPLGGLPEDFPPEPDPNQVCDEGEEFPDCVAGGDSAPDADGDGVPDDDDLCPDTPEGERVDENGCSESQGGNPPPPSDCEGTEDPVMGECLPTNELPGDPNDFCDEGEEFPDCVAGDPGDVTEIVCDAEPTGEACSEPCDPETDPGCEPPCEEDCEPEPGCEGIENPVTGECLGNPLDILEELGIDENGNGMPDALEDSFAPSCFDYGGQPVYLCHHGMGNGVGGAIYGDAWEGYAIIVFGLVIML